MLWVQVQPVHSKTLVCSVHGKDNGVKDKFPPTPAERCNVAEQAYGYGIAGNKFQHFIFLLRILGILI